MNNVENKALRRVLLVYRELIPSIRLCGHCQLESLAKRGIIEYRAVQEMALSVADMNWAEIAVLGRLDSWYELQIARRLHRSGRYVIYILDDDLLNISPDVSSAAFYAQPEVRENILGMIGESDALLTPSPLLADKYARDGRVALMTEEPALDPVPYAAHDSSGPVKIGFAGSIDRKGDLDRLLREALLRVRDRYGERVRFEFFGAKPDFIPALNARHIPYCDSYDVYRKTLDACAWDIGLAPLAASEFNACKHYNKFCEYAAAGIVGIYSDCMPYTRIPDRALYGRFCSNTPEEWYDAICALIDDREAREACRERCCACAAGPLNVDAVADALWRDLTPLTEDLRLRQIPGNSLKMLKLHNVRLRAADILKRYGFKTPFVAAKKVLGRILR
ncbi:MAG: hypothetical protein IJH86_09055 [Clostridia bacterium]|nr:hypothetical protein [Clostridia bacterium]